LVSPASYPTPTATLTGQPPVLTISPTPSCAAGLLAVKFNSFDTFGIVRFDIFSQHTTTTTLKGFNINWQKYVNSQRLRKVSLGAPPGQLGAVVVWDSGNVDEDATPSTNSHSEGTWLTDFTLPPGALGSPSVTPIFFDFAGINRYDDYSTSTTPLYGGASDFNYSNFGLSCGSTDGSATLSVTPEVLPVGTLITPTSAPGAVPARNFYTALPVTLSWNAVSWATAYKIEITPRDFDSIESFTQVVPANTLSYSIDILANGTYYWRVMALGGTVNKWSTIERFTVSVPP